MKGSKFIKDLLTFLKLVDNYSVKFILPIYFKYNMQENFYSPEEISYGGSDLPTSGRIKFSYDIKDYQKKTAVGQPNPWNWSSTKYLRGEIITLSKRRTLRGFKYLLMQQREYFSKKSVCI